LVDIGDVNVFPGEHPTLYHLIRARKRREQRDITAVKGVQENTHKTNRSILQAFTLYIQDKYKEKTVDNSEINKMGSYLKTKVTQGENDELEEGVKLEELMEAVRQGKNRKAPGRDGICQEFYKTNWSTVKTEILEVIRWMHSKREIDRSQKHGIIVFIPKAPHAAGAEDYRPLTLLNTDLKILARIIARRLDRVSSRILHAGKHCGVGGKSILEAAATLRDVIAYAETTHTNHYVHCH
jgi:hypothetical protein